MNNTVDSLLDHVGITYGDSSIAAYPSLGVITFCDMRIYPDEAADMIALLRLAVRSPREIPRKRFWNIPRSHDDSEVDAFFVESGDNQAAAYLDDVELQVEDVEIYEKHLSAAIAACQPVESRSARTSTQQDGIL